jgi:hypothetical protein
MEKGIILDCLNELFKHHMSTIMKSKLDAIVISWCALPNQRFTKAYMDVYPRLHFRDGITTLTDITANTVVGFMFAVVLAGLTRDGRSLFEDMDDETYLNMIYTFESLLCFWAWLKKDKYWKIEAGKEALQTAEHAICILMGKIKSLWPRNQGCEWKKPKFHETYHNAFNIHLFGKPANRHSGPAEHNHICHVKNIAQKTQKRWIVFDLQLGNRLVDKFIIDKAYAQIQHARHKLGLETMEPIITMENASLESTTNMGVNTLSLSSNYLMVKLTCRTNGCRTDHNTTNYRNRCYRPLSTNGLCLYHGRKD